MKHSKLFGLVALSVLSLVGCTRGGTGSSAGGASNSATPTQKEKLVIGGPSLQKDWIKSEVETFLTQNNLSDKYTVENYTLGESDVNNADKISDWTVGPDLFAYASDQTLGLVQKGILGEVPSTFATAMRTNMADEAIAAAKVGTKMYGYPYAGDNGYFLYYNKSVFKDQEAKLDTIDGIVEVCKANKLKFSYKIAEPFFSVGLLFTFGARYNVTLSTDETSIANITADFNGEKGLKAAKAMRSIVQNPTIDTTKEGQKAPTKANGLAACVDGSWNAGTYSEAMGNDYGCVKLPTVTVDGETKNLSAFLGYKLYGVNKQKSQSSEKLAVLHKLANYLVSSSVQEKRFDDLTIAPTDKTVKAMAKVQNTPHVKALADQAQFAVAQTIVPNGAWTEATNPYTPILAKGSETITDAELQSYMDSFNVAVTTK